MKQQSRKTIYLAIACLALAAGTAWSQAQSRGYAKGPVNVNAQQLQQQGQQAGRANRPRGQASGRGRGQHNGQGQGQGRRQGKGRPWGMNQNRGPGQSVDQGPGSPGASQDQG